MSARAASFERWVEKYTRKVWKHRWLTFILSGAYLAFFISLFILGLLDQNSLLVSVSGLAISLYVWLAGLAIYTAVDIRQCRDLVVSRANQSWAAQQAVLKNIRSVSHYALVITLSYTFWLGMFPDGKVWVATFVILSGILLLTLLSHLLGKDSAKPLGALRFLTLCYLILAIKLALSMGLFPNFTEFMRVKWIPTAGERINSWMMSWVTPAKATPPPTGDLDKPTTADESASDTPPTPPKGETGGNIASGATGGSTSNSSGSSKKHRDLKGYLDERRAKLRVDFPDLFPNGSETPASLPAEQNLPTTFPPAITPTTGETLTPFGLPPVKQLP